MMCKLLDLEIPSGCPNTRCMYHTKNGGCLRDGELTTVDLRVMASSKGVPMAHIEMRVDEGERNIRRILTLDKYREFLQGTTLSVFDPPEWVDTLLNDDLRVVKFNAVLLCAALSNKNWRLFDEAQANPIEFTRKELLGLTGKDFRRLRTHVKWIIAGGVTPAVRRKRRIHLPVETPLEQLTCLAST